MLIRIRLGLEMVRKHAEYSAKFRLSEQAGGIAMFIKALPVGVDDFEKMVTRDYYFVDKINFIKALLEIKGDVNLSGF